ncbi:MAG TPA: hypothetical protein IAC53_04910 [Candidatus Fimenecus excrementigallinarum]|uniref:Uncharacterized protein n=1 Tax=Candidatus Fimenecus excrementigallinarum TaxID=2840816 RepID=A0A9D1LDR2_9FIRM|nr:hypothetical protein [Candidatus Fimenecus excrementigallinarum]
MTAALAIRSVLELAFIGLLLYGFLKEDKIIAFERRIYRILFVNYRRYKRKKLYAKMQKARAFRVYEGGSPKKASGGSVHVA